MDLSVAHDDGCEAFAQSVAAFVAACGGLGEYELLGSSRCHGWTRLDVVAHILAGWQELLGGLACRSEAPATVDAASYWAAYMDHQADTDPVLALMAQRRRTAVYSRPSAALAQLGDVAEQLAGAVAALSPGRHRFQGLVLTSGDLLTSWAVENGVHHLDLLVVGPPPAAALRLVRASVEALLGEPLPDAWDDEYATLVVTGRTPVPDDAAHLVDRLPVLG
ncbi:MAG: maleylpyruvate isomerase N-terminal domain-containing protein [Dermatophilaceae bacterium]